ncbi:MAG: HAD hydrolase-like protein, partial [Pseudomonadota bacterium]
MQTLYSMILLDLDGTLSDPLQGIGRSINHALHKHDFAVLPIDDLAWCVGPPLDQSFARLTGVTDKDLVMSLVLAYRERYLDIGFAENELYDGIVPALDALHSADTPMALCTSKPEPGTRKILARFGLSHYFRFLSCGDVGVQKWQQINALREERKVDQGAIMIGDRAVDIEAGQRNGLATGAVTWGYGSRDELSSADPMHWFDNPADWVSFAHETTTEG